MNGTGGVVVTVHNPPIHGEHIGDTGSVEVIVQQPQTLLNVTVDAFSGVNLVVNGNYAVNFGNKATLNITAPTTGTTKGIAIARIRTATSTVTQAFSNNTTLNTSGAIHFPNQIAPFDNNVTIEVTNCNSQV